MFRPWNTVLVCCCCCLFVCLFVFDRALVSLYMLSWLSWNSLCRPGWPRTQRFACLSTESTKAVSVILHLMLYLFRNIQPFTPEWMPRIEPSHPKFSLSSNMFIHLTITCILLAKILTTCSYGWRRLRKMCAHLPFLKEMIFKQLDIYRFINFIVTLTHLKRPGIFECSQGHF